MSIRPAAAPELAKFELLDEIGHGGMATVYRARDLRLGREVAVKLIHPHLRENKEVAARFVAEARTVAKLRHPGIVEVFDVSDDASDKERYLVAELVRGPSLRKILADHPEMPPEIGACFGALLSDALAHAHAAGIVHRDVKPENVLVESDAAHETARVKLTDFGIAKILDAQGVTSTGQVLGSPAHMAPEQIEGGNVDVRTDVFSLGVLIYECMAGRLPFEGKNPAQVLKKVLECSYAPADKIRPTVGARWGAILAGAIARDPADRYADIQALGADLRRELSEAGIEDLSKEIYRYLNDPAAYEKALVPALVDTLIARAQKARRKRDVRAAAADLNRAVAYRPDDPDLLRQVTALAQGQWRRLAMRRIAIGAGVAVVVAAGVPLTARLLRRTTRDAPILPVVQSAERSDPTASVAPLSSTSPVASVTPSTHVPRLAIPTIVRPVAVTELRDRVVLITAVPKTAFVSIDRGPASEVGFNGKQVKLPAGKHTFYFSPPPSADTSCCDPVSLALDIEGDDGSGKPKVVHGSLVLHPAKLTLTGAPPGGHLVCNTKGIDMGNTTVSVPMSQISEMIGCLFTPLGKTQSVSATAGRDVVVAWPAGP
jgi:eukaryotic-like serine/threonine-protein kinase